MYKNLNLKLLELINDKQEVKDNSSLLQVVDTFRDKCCYECVKCKFELFQYTNASDREKCFNCSTSQRAVNG